MAKRTAALVVAMMLWMSGAAGASPTPLWACTVPVWIEPGPFHDAAVVAVGQLDDATVISWPIVDDRSAPVRIRAEVTDLGTHANLAASETAFVWAEVIVDLSTTAKRQYMTGLLHELGHIAGLGHNDEARSVMNATDVQWRRFQAVDLEALADVACS